MRLTSHECWQLRDAIKGSKGGPQGKFIKDVVISPNNNAYALKFEDGTYYDMTTYCSVEITNN